MYPLADMLIRITNAQAVRHEHVSLPFSKIKFAVAQLLKESGYLGEVERRKRKGRTTEHEYLDFVLKYLPAGQAGDQGIGAISGIKIVSRPSRRVYAKAAALRPVRSGYGIAVLSTPNGIRSNIQARKEKVGGEVLFEIW